MPRHIVDRFEADLRGKAAEIKGLADRVNELLGVIAEKDRHIAELERDNKRLMRRGS